MYILHLLTLTEVVRMLEKFIYRRFIYMFSLLILIYQFISVVDSNALPHYGSVISGNGNISTSSGKMIIKQNTSNLKINWNSFNIRSGQKVIFIQPNSSSVAINTVTSANPSYIYGALSANGIVFLVNPYGITIGPGGMVNTGGFLAAAENMSQKTNGNYFFSGNGSVSNSGIITVGQADNVTFIGTTVTNSGSIVSKQGTVSIGASNSVEVDFNATNQVLLNVSPNTVVSTIDEYGAIKNNGGRIQLTAGASNALARSVVNVSGMVMAETTDNKPGSISINSSLTNGTTTLEPTAVIDASAPTGGNGGHVSINGHTVSLNETSNINVLAAAGINGTTTIDPTILNIGTASGLENIDSNQSGYITDTICLTSNINLGGYSWTPLGNGLSSRNYFTGTFNGNGYVVSNYTVTATNSNGTGFVGFLGDGGVVKNLGLSGSVNGGTYNNIGGIVGLNFSGGTVEYSYNTGRVSGNYYLGGIVGYNYGTVKTSYNAGTVLGSAYAVGGVVGYNSGTVEYSYNTGSISSGSYYVGGVVGENGGTVKYSYNTGSVQGNTCVGGLIGVDINTNSNTEYSYSASTVSGSSFVGGVVGGNFSGEVANTYYNNTIFSGSGTGNGDVGTTGLSTSNFENKSNFTNLGTFNTWNSSTESFNTTPLTSAPWFEGKVVSGSGTIMAPMLVPDFSTATVTGKNGSSVYNGETVTNAYNATYTMGGMTLSPNVTVTVGPNVGTYTNTPTYSISAPTTQTSVDSVKEVSGTWEWTITPLDVTSTPNSVTMTYGDTVPTLSGTFSTTGPTGGLNNLSATWTTTATGASNVGSYAITPSYSYMNGAVAGDFFITPATNSFKALTINSDTLTFSGSVSNPTKVYDGTTTATLTPANSHAALTGFVNGQGATYTGASGSYSSPNVGTGISVSSTLRTIDFLPSGSGFSWSNYSLPTMKISGTGTINPLFVTAMANQVEITHGDQIPTLSGIFSTIGTNSGIENISATWITSATSSSPAGSYNINPGTYSYKNGAVANDFIITESNSNANALRVVNAPVNKYKLQENTNAYMPFVANSSVYITEPFYNFDGDSYSPVMVSGISTGINGEGIVLQSNYNNHNYIFLYKTK